MQTTEKNHWQSGYSRRGGFTRKYALHIFAFRLFNLGVFISNRKPRITLFRLITKADIATCDECEKQIVLILQEGSFCKDHAPFYPSTKE